MSSKRRLRRKQCGSKQQHPTQAIAVSALISLKRTDKSINGLTTYKCKFCHKWHVGHRPRKGVKT